jgi:protein-tyrosine phosphatase
VLFLCTGNYYRSRFAEIVFNHLAEERKLNWRADSRGLAPQFSPGNVGTISPYTLAALEQLNIPCPDFERFPLRCIDDDLRASDLVVAIKEAEHRPLLVKHYAGWEDRVEYWHVHDLDEATAEQAMPQIEQRVRRLVERLSA